MRLPYISGALREVIDCIMLKLEPTLKRKRDTVQLKVSFAPEVGERYIQLEELFPTGYERKSGGMDWMQSQEAVREASKIPDEEVALMFSACPMVAPWTCPAVDPCDVQREVVIETVDSVIPVKTTNGVDPSWYFMDELLQHYSKNRSVDDTKILDAIGNVAISGKFSFDKVKTSDSRVNALRTSVHAKVLYLKERLADHGKVVMLPSTCNWYTENICDVLDLCERVTQ